MKKLEHDVSPDRAEVDALLRAALWPAAAVAWRSIYGPSRRPPDSMRGAFDAASSGGWFGEDGQPTAESARVVLTLAGLSAWPVQGSARARWVVVRSALVAVALDQPVTAATIRELSTREGIATAIVKRWLAETSTG